MTGQFGKGGRPLPFGVGYERTNAKAWLEKDAPILPLGREFLAYWLSKCPSSETGQAFPRREDIHPEDIPHLLPYIFIVDVLRGGGELDFRFRLVGTKIVTIEGEHTGQRISDMFPDREGYSVLWQQYRDAAAGAVWVRHEILRWPEQDQVAYEVVLAPLQDDRGQVTMLLGLAHPPEH
ncbi:PAS domain-containing protein [Pelagibius marinus]|uniref:PAS domain-containing protein n=1 Tax=Pelagibius marinus TaxID=2762760 RepID=UPI0018727EA4|nr:PAS domain-containing protein [Pelagibius marinus]